MTQTQVRGGALCFSTVVRDPWSRLHSIAEAQGRQVKKKKILMPEGHSKAITSKTLHGRPWCSQADNCWFLIGSNFRMCLVESKNTSFCKNAYNLHKDSKEICTTLHFIFISFSTGFLRSLIFLNSNTILRRC